jgi:hypothetical protein
MAAIVRFRAKTWLYQGPAPWMFVTLPKGASARIREAFGHGRGFGSVRVKARVGETSWATSIFPDKKSGAYLLPLKKEVRKAESIENDATVYVELRLQG